MPEPLMFDLTGFLTKSPLFSCLSASELEPISGSSQRVRYPKDYLVFRVGDPCEWIHLVVSGQVKLFVTAGSGQEKVIEIISPGQSFAEALVFLDKPCFLSAQALTETVLVNVSKRAVVSEIQRDTRFAIHMLAGVSRRLHGLIRDVEDYALRNGMQRLIGYLLRDVDISTFAGQSALTVALPASKSTVASRLSLTPEYFSRILHALEAQGLIEIQSRNILILDIQGLVSSGM